MPLISGGPIPAFILRRREEEETTRPPIPPLHTGHTLFINSSALDEEGTQNFLRMLNENEMQNYVNVMYHIELSIVGDVFSGGNSYEDLLKKPIWHMASSDDTYKSVDGVRYAGSTENVFKIESLNFITYNSITTLNPDSTDSVLFKLGLKEVHGFSFDKEVRKAIDIMYRDFLSSTITIDRRMETATSLTPNRITFRMDIRFSGYDQSGNYIENISFTNPYPKFTTISIDEMETVVPNFGDGISGELTQTDRFTYFLVAYELETDVSTTASTYNLNLVNFREIPRVQEYDTINHELIEMSNLGNAATLEQFFDNLVEQLNEKYGKVVVNQRIVETTRGLPNLFRPERSVVTENRNIYSAPETIIDVRTFEINIPDELKNEIIETSRRNIITRLTSSNSIIQTIRDAVTATDKGKVGIIGEGTDELNLPYPRWFYEVKTNIDYSGATHNSTINDVVGYKVIYTISKVYDYRVRFANRTTYNDAAKNIGLVDMALASGSLKRIYKYAFSGQNTEVMDFKINLKLFWQYSRNELGLNRDVVAFKRFQTIEEYINDLSPAALSGSESITYTPLLTTNGLETLRREITHNISNINNDIFPFRTSTSVIPLGEAIVRSGQQADNTEDGTPLRTAIYNSQYQQMIDADLMNLDNLNLIGDPQWLAAPMSKEGHNLPDLANMPIYTDLVYLRIIQPEQDDYMNPSRIDQPYTEEAVLSGFYQIISVEHNFADGKYTQKLNGHRVFIGGLGEV